MTGVGYEIGKSIPLLTAGLSRLSLAYRAPLPPDLTPESGPEDGGPSQGRSARTLGPFDLDGVLSCMDAPENARAVSRK